MLNLSSLLFDIQEHFEKEYPREGCGLLGIEKGKLIWIPCRNVAEQEDDFIMSSEDYLEARKKWDIYAIVHSHPDASNEPSEADINNCNALGIKYIIFSYPSMDMNIIEPKEVFSNLIGREYKFGSTDCFEAARDYYLSQKIVVNKRAFFEDDWWTKGLNYFNEDFISSYGFKKVEEPMRNDLLIFQVSAGVPNHCGVYLGNDIFFHHAVSRLSCRENLYPFWVRHLVGIYRYES